MENKYLEGNERIEQVLAVACEEGLTEEHYQALITVLQQRMREDGHLLLPVEFPDENDPNRFLMRGLPNENGDVYLACFTSEEELQKGEKSAVMSNFIDVFLEAAVEQEDVRGIVINPWGNAVSVPKTILQIILEARKPRENDYLRNNFLLSKAIRFAVDHHAGQLRKGTTTPYILHPLETMNILKAMNADPNLLMAGLLHDTIEDTDVTFTDIVEKFGTDVAGLVNAHSEDKSKTWDERKMTAIEELKSASWRLKMLVMADKVSNLRSMMADYKEIGEELWTRFNAPKEKQAWYYSGILEALGEMQNDPHTAPVYWEMTGLYKDLFVRYYLETLGFEENDQRLLQLSAHGEAYVLVRGCPQWQVEREPDIVGLLPLCREEAEALEDEWNKPFWALIEKDLEDHSYTIVKTKNRVAEVKLEKGLLSLNGAETGDAGKAIGAPQGYEYYVGLEEEETRRFLTQLRIDYGVNRSLEDVFLAAFGNKLLSVKMMDYCKEKGIRYFFHAD